jgi:hypothetical protein
MIDYFLSVLNMVCPEGGWTYLLHNHNYNYSHLKFVSTDVMSVSIVGHGGGYSVTTYNADKPDIVMVWRLGTSVVFDIGDHESVVSAFRRALCNGRIC